MSSKAKRTLSGLPGDVLLTLGEPMPYVMDQAGHTSPAMTLGIYARVMRRSGGEKARLRALVDGGELPAVSARNGAETAQTTPDPFPQAPGSTAELAR